MMPHASIDLGTNTARLLVGNYGNGVIEPIAVMKEIIRLGGGFTAEEGISNEAASRALITLSKFRDVIDRHCCTKIRAVATSAVREASNSRTFTADIFSSTGITLDVINGLEEGLLTLKGVKAGVNSLSEYQLVFDLGGGSTEFTLAQNYSPLFTESLPLGVVRLCEDFGSEEEMRKYSCNSLNYLKQRLIQSNLIDKLSENCTLIATAGTATTLAAIKMEMTEYDYRMINGVVLSQEYIQSVFRKMQSLKSEERLKIPGMEKGREDLIIPGIMFTLMTMEVFGFSELTVSDYGLLEGAFISSYES